MTSAGKEEEKLTIITDHWPVNPPKLEGAYIDNTGQGYVVDADSSETEEKSDDSKPA